MGALVEAGACLGAGNRLYFWLAPTPGASSTIRGRAASGAWSSSWPQHDGGETALNETGGVPDARGAPPCFRDANREKA
jgi:hypothetical protein